MKKQSIYIIISVCILTLLMNFVDAVITPPYFIKSLVKIALFLIAPLIYFVMNKAEQKELKKLFIPNKKALLQAVLLGIGCYVIIVGGYFLLKNYFDFSNITESLMSGVGVNSDNLLYVTLYISFCNSFIEEFFFRGFAFMTLKRNTSRWFAYLFSSVLFALYHIGMTLGWVHIFVFSLCLVGLIIGGCIFNYLNEKSENLYPSWIVHMFANFGINTLGFILFEII